MGAVTFSIDEELVKIIKNHLPIEIFVETGTFKGDTIETVRNYFKKIYSVELSPELCQQAQERFKGHEHIEIIQQDSPAVLQQLKLTLSTVPTLYWLDAHWCVAEDTAGNQSQCPLLKELAAIEKLHPYSVIIIDDARLFLSTPPIPHETEHWPEFEEVLTSLKNLSEQHHFAVVNDCMIFSPKKCRMAINHYARHFGIDWLHVLNKSRKWDKKEFEIRESFPSPLQPAPKPPLTTRIRHYPIKKLKQLLRPLTTPLLGNLSHHVPKPLAIPRRYSKIKMQHYPKISIVTPSLNQANYLEKTIQSVTKQAYRNLEYIIQDGGSHDKTLEIIKQYASQITHWESKHDNGQAEALNRGFEFTSGDIMAYLNSDDMLLPGTLNYVANYFANHPEVDVVYGHRILIDENDNEIGRWILPLHDPKVILWADYIPQETLFWRRSSWEKVGNKLDESFHFAMDWDLILRFQEIGAQFARLPRFLGAFRVHSQQKTSTQMSITGINEMQRILSRLHQRTISPTEIKNATKNYLNKHLVNHYLYKFGILRY